MAERIVFAVVGPGGVSMRKFFVFALVLFVLGVRPSVAQSITFANGISFLNYKTYKWVTVPSTEQLDELTSNQLMGTIEVELAKKGLTRTQSDNPDLLIAYEIASGKGKQLKNLSAGAAYGSNDGASAGTTGTVTTIHSGELALDMYDAAKRQLVWRGLISNAIEADAKPDKKQKHMSAAIEKLLKHYPPEKKP
jgi:hypothetical protein